MKNESINYHTLSNGIRLVHRHSSSAVSYLGLIVGCGTRDEQAQINGAAHFVEHCVFKGTEKRTAKQLLSRIEEIGGDINAYTTKEETVFYSTVPSRYVERAIDVIADMVLHPSFPEEEIDKERGVVLDEMESYEDIPTELIYDDFDKMLFAGHPLQLPIVGTKKTVKGLKASSLRQFMQDNYVHEQMVIFALTSLSFNRMIEYAERYFSGSTYNRQRIVERAKAQIVIPQNKVIRRRTHMDHILIGNSAYTIYDKRIPALHLLNNILGGESFNARLNYTLREQKGLVYSVGSLYVPLSDTGYWNIYFSSEKDNTQQCIDLIYKELKRISTTPLSQSEIQRAVRQLKGQMMINAENMENTAISMGKSILHLGRASSWQEKVSRIEKLTSEEVFVAAQEIYGGDNFFFLKYE